MQKDFADCHRNVTTAAPRIATFTAMRVWPPSTRDANGVWRRRQGVGGWSFPAENRRDAIQSTAPFRGRGSTSGQWPCPPAKSEEKFGTGTREPRSVPHSGRPGGTWPCALSLPTRSKASSAKDWLLHRGGLSGAAAPAASVCSGRVTQTPYPLSTPRPILSSGCAVLPGAGGPYRRQQSYICLAKPENRVNPPLVHEMQHASTSLERKSVGDVLQAGRQRPGKGFFFI